LANRYNLTDLGWRTDLTNMQSITAIINHLLFYHKSSGK